MAETGVDPWVADTGAARLAGVTEGSRATVGVGIGVSGGTVGSMTGPSTWAGVARALSDCSGVRSGSLASVVTPGAVAAVGRAGCSEGPRSSVQADRRASPIRVATTKRRYMAAPRLFQELRGRDDAEPVVPMGEYSQEIRTPSVSTLALTSCGITTTLPRHRTRVPVPSARPVRWADDTTPNSLN